MLIVLSEASEQMEPSASARDIRASTEAARLVGCRVFTIPPDFERCETAENALFHVPAQSVEAPAVWTGYIPTAERYEAIYDAALSKGIHLVNTPHQHLDAQEFDRAYVLLGDLTPQSVTVTDITQVRDAARQLQFPVFLKGTVQSRKSRGWKACVATNEEEAERLASQLFSLENRSRGRVVLRRFVRLRYARTTPGTDFPLGREYRVFLINGRIAGQGYYWEGDDPLSSLTPSEDQAVRQLAEEAARRVGTPYIAVDIGQLESGKWIVIETGDAQFSGLSQIPPLMLWHNVRRVAESATAA